MARALFGRVSTGELLGLLSISSLDLVLHMPLRSFDAGEAALQHYSLRCQITDSAGYSNALKSKSLKRILDEQLCTFRSIPMSPVLPLEKTIHNRLGPGPVIVIPTSPMILLSICKDDSKEMQDVRYQGLLRNRVRKAISALGHTSWVAKQCNAQPPGRSGQSA